MAAGKEKHDVKQTEFFLKKQRQGISSGSGIHAEWPEG
jgi:hypothetical protein